MQYFAALTAGRKRVAAAREHLDRLTGGRAMPALALKDSKAGSWEPVGEESLYAFVDDSAGFVLTDSSGKILALVDADGLSKAIVQGVTGEQAGRLREALEAGGVREYRGKVTLPA